MNTFLVAEEALLHKLCSTKFLNFHDLSTEQGGGRKIDEDRKALLSKLCDRLDNEMEHNLFTLDQVHEKMRSLDQTADKSLAYSKRYLKEKLKQKYDKAIYFTSQERQADVLCFKYATANIIRDYHNDIGDDEKTRIIKTAVKLIKNDIALVDLDSFHYPSVDSMANLDSQLALIPQSLKLFLEPLLKSEKRVAAWGRSIIKTSRPRSGVMPFMMRFALRIDHRFGSKWLIDELHSVGFCESYHEVGNYNYCYLRNKLKSKMESTSLQTIEGEVEEEELAVDSELQIDH